MRRTSSPLDSAVVNASATPVSAQSSPLPTLMHCQPLIPTTTIYAQGEPWCGRPSYQKLFGRRVRSGVG
eukprot:701372-Amphidinium_carterae.3